MRWSPNLDGALCLEVHGHLWGATWLTGSGWRVVTYRPPLYPTPTSIRARYHGLRPSKRDAMRQVERIAAGALPGA